LVEKRHYARLNRRLNDGYQLKRYILSCIVANLVYTINFPVRTFPGMVYQTIGVWCSGVWRWIHLRELELELETGTDNEEDW